MAKNDIDKKLTVREFFKRFPDEETCLEHVMVVRYGLRHTCRACGVVEATFHKLANRKAWACAHCGDNLYPCAGTIFQDTRTPLQVWFYAIYLFVATRHGVSGKELQRQLGVTYKTAYRMGQQIRALLAKADGKEPLGGIGKHVEVDECYVGGRRSGKRGRGAEGKVIVVGFKERGGRVRAEVIPNVSKAALQEAFRRNVKPGTIISTDEWGGYNLVTPDGHWHGTVKHGAGEYANTDELGIRHHTNGIESFWNLFKNSVKSTHIHISADHAPKYINEFCYRSNHRAMGNAMFDALIAAV